MLVAGGLQYAIRSRDSYNKKVENITLLADLTWALAVVDARLHHSFGAIAVLSYALIDSFRRSSDGIATWQEFSNRANMGIEKFKALAENKYSVGEISETDFMDAKKYANDCLSSIEAAVYASGLRMN